MKPVRRNILAREDIEHAVTDYLEQVGGDLVDRFVDALESATEHLERHPRSGSPHIAEEVGIPALRSWTLGRFPYAFYYFDRPDHVYIWRLLHVRRDFSAQLGGEPGS